MTQLETRTEPMVVNFGPHHPSMHGVLRLVVTLDGEDVVDCEPVIGYLHRGMEKIAENRTNVMFVPYVSRWDYAAGMFNEAITVNAPERLADITVPKRASHIRVLMLELNRIANHLLWLGPFLADVGAQTPFFYIFREREMIYDLWEAATGQRLINNNYFRIGGVAADLPYGWLEKCLDFCDYFGPKIDEYEKLITNNPIFKRRIEGLGVISREMAINWSLSGPMLRASWSALGSAQGGSLRVLRRFRVGRGYRQRRRLLRPLSGADRGNAPVAEDPQAGRQGHPRRSYRESRSQADDGRQGRRFLWLRLPVHRQESGSNLQDSRR